MHLGACGLLLACIAAAQGDARAGTPPTKYPAYPRCPVLGTSDKPCAELFKPLNPAEYEAWDFKAQRLPLKDRAHEASAYVVANGDTRLASLAAQPSGGLLAVGGFGFRTALISSDGQSWHVADHLGGGADFARAAAYADSARAFAAGTSGRMLRTQDGGTHWEVVNRTFSSYSDPMRRDLAYDGSAYGIAFADPTHGVVVGEGRLLRTEDGGQTWIRVPLSGGDVALQGAHFIDATRGWVVGSGGSAWRTDDAGAHWQSISIGNDRVHLMDVSFADAQHGCLGGDFKVWCTWDGGMHWQPASIALPNTLDTSAAIGIVKLRLLDGARAWLITNNGWIFASQDGGRHWSPWMDVTAAVRGKLQNIQLWGMAFADGKLWAAGGADRDSGKGGDDALGAVPLLLSWQP